MRGPVGSGTAWRRLQNRVKLCEPIAGLRTVEA
jgi:hypothetical protein